jgi:hemolysin III
VAALVNIDSALAPSLADLDVPLGHPLRPLWRGRLHALALYVAVPATAALFLIARTGRARFGVGVYAVGLLSMFAVSATYHRWVHTKRARDLWRRLDHAVIYATIAGSMTPIVLVAIPDRWGLPLLGVMWVGGIVGMLIKIFAWRHQRVVGGTLYITLGWVGAFAIPSLWMHQGVWPAVLILVGGAFYTVGAIGLYRRWPTLSPAVFSYHEVWHASTIAAAAAHLAAVWIVVG